MRKIKMLLIIGLVVLLTGCSKQGINQLDDLYNKKVDYTVRISFEGPTFDYIDCEFDNKDFTCEHEETGKLTEEEYEYLEKQFFFHTYLKPSDFYETSENEYKLTEDGKRAFVQRLPFFKDIVDQYENLDDAIDAGLEGFGDAVVILEDNKILTITLLDSSNSVMLVYTFDFE